MDKRLLCVIITAFVLFSLNISVTAAESSDIVLELNGSEIKGEVAPIIKDNRTLVPLRVIFEAFGAEINWDEETKTITGRKNSLIIKLVIDSKDAYINDKIVKLDVPATIIKGRTLVPVRFISESLGSIVEWDSKNKKVVIAGMIQSNYESQEKMADNYVKKYGEFFDKQYKLKISDEDSRILIENGAAFFDAGRDLRSLKELCKANSKVRSVEYKVAQLKEYKDGEDIITAAMCIDDTKKDMELYLVYYTGYAINAYEGLHCVINGINIGNTKMNIQVEGESKELPVTIMIAGNFYDGALDFAQEEKNEMLEKLLKNSGLTN